MENLNYSFAEVVAVWHQKNGKPKFNFKHKQCEIFRVLQTLGFRRGRAGHRFIYYIRTKKSVVPVTFNCLKNGFANYLKQCDANTLPKGITAEAVIEQYFKEKPIVENESLKLHLDELLNSEEVAKLLSYPIEYN